MEGEGERNEEEEEEKQIKKRGGRNKIFFSRTGQAPDAVRPRPLGGRPGPPGHEERHQPVRARAAGREGAVLRERRGRRRKREGEGRGEETSPRIFSRSFFAFSLPFFFAFSLPFFFAFSPSSARSFALRGAASGQAAGPPQGLPRRGPRPRRRERDAAGAPAAGPQKRRKGKGKGKERRETTTKMKGSDDDHAATFAPFLLSASASRFPFLLPGVVTARDFVLWANGHPELVRPRPRPPLPAVRGRRGGRERRSRLRSAAAPGQAGSFSEAPTPPAKALSAVACFGSDDERADEEGGEERESEGLLLAHGPRRRRRGAAQAAFSAKELREALSLPGVSVFVHHPRAVR